MGSYHSTIKFRNSKTSNVGCISYIYSKRFKRNYTSLIDDGSADSISNELNEKKYKSSNLFVVANSDLGYDITRVDSNYDKVIKFVQYNRLKITDYQVIANYDATL